MEIDARPLGDAPLNVRIYMNAISLIQIRTNASFGMREASVKSAR